MNNTNTTIEAPAGELNVFGQPIEPLPHYTDVHREQIAEIVDWMAEKNRDVTDKKKLVTQTWLARAARLKPAAVNQVLRGKYASPPDAQLRAMLDAIADYERKAEFSGASM